MIKKELEDFSLKATLESGQIFRYHHSSRDGFYHVVVGDAIIRIRQQRNKIEYGCSNGGFDVAKFLGLNHNYNSIIANITKDKIIAAAVKKHHGLRLIEQELWECTASFICSSFSNIPRIRQCIEKVAATFGDKIEFGGVKAYSFPQPQQINSWAKLKNCGLGYRAKYLFETARIFANNSENYSLQRLRKLGYTAAKEKLMELPGVGSKVADCILLFSCGFHEAFPVDVWIQRVMETNYNKELSAFSATKAVAAGRSVPKRVSENIVGEFARAYFGKYAGYAQQFLYHYGRSHKLKHETPEIPKPQIC